MAIDFGRVRARQTTLAAVVGHLTVDDLADATEFSVARMEEVLAEATDADVTFVPEDPGADDPAAEDPADRDLAWNLGHLIVHVTASAEESAALAAELARGVPFHGRSRWEVPWQSVTTIEQARRRLDESRRMRLASLQMWPDTPPADYDPDGVPTRTQAKERFARGLSHEDSHIEQIQDVLKQAKAGRRGG